MEDSKIRAVAICIFRKGDEILVAEGEDPIGGRRFYRPIGGGIEFCERSQDTVIREVREELSLEITNVRYIGTLEDIFTFYGNQKHEIIMIYEGEFVDPATYDRPFLEGKEHRSVYRAVWVKLSDFDSTERILVPEGLVEIISANSIRP